MPGHWMRDAAIVRDRNLRLQYLAGLGLNLYQSDRIYADMLTHARYPEGLLTGSPSTPAALREAIVRQQGRGPARSRPCSDGQNVYECVTFAGQVQFVNCHGHL